MRVLDSHHHLWDPARRAYAWMDASVKPIRRRFDADDLRAAAPPAVTRTIAVQAAHALDETEDLLATAAASDLIAGVVGWVDLTARDVAQTLARLRAKPGGAKLCGIRHQVENEPDPEWLLRPDVAGGLEAVSAAGLAYDLLVRTHQLRAAAAVVRRHPGLRFVLDHGAKPNIAERAWEPWASDIAALAAAPNVVCKLSGLVTEANRSYWKPGDVAPYAERLLDAFGPRRLLFGSDWPVCLLAATYADVLSLARELVAPLDEPERAAVFEGNAQRVYLERPA